MLTYTELTALEHSLRERHVLSVYIDGTVPNPAEKHAWRVRVDQSLNDVRAWLAGSAHDEREEFERCAERLLSELDAFRGNVRGPGWAGFFVSNRVCEASRLPVPVPTRVVWSTGISVAPYMRVLKEARPVAVVLVDATRADLYRYEGGELKAIDTVRAHHVVTPPAHMGNAPRAGFHPGTRGDTGHDSAQRSLEEGTRRMMRDVETKTVRIGGPDGWIVAGGIPKISHQLTEHLQKLAPGRVLDLPSLDVHSTEAQLAEAARFAAHTLRSLLDARRITDVIDDEQAQGLGTLGLTSTSDALDRWCVRELYLTGSFIERHPAAAEDAVRAAIDQDAVVEQVAGDAEIELDAHGGIAARLRYRMVPYATAEESAVLTGDSTR